MFCCLVVQDDFGLFLELKSHLVDGIRQCINVPNGKNGYHFKGTKNDAFFGSEVAGPSAFKRF